MKPDDILEIRCSLRIFDVAAMRSHTRHVYELLPDGTVRYFRFETGVRRPEEKQVTHTATASDYGKLCEAINACVASAEGVNRYTDDCTGQVKLVRAFGRVDTMDRGYGNRKTDLYDILTGYIHGVGGMEW